MQLQILKTIKFFRWGGRSADTLSLKAISKKNLIYFISWIAIFIWLYSYFFPMGEFKFESKLYYDNVGNLQIYTYTCLIIACMISVFLMERNLCQRHFLVL